MADLPAKKQEEETKLHEEEEDDKKESTTLLSHTRVRRIIKSDPDTKQIANDSVFLICRATEMFLDQFAKLVYQETVKDKKKSITYSHMAKVVREVEELEFLNDIIPEQTPL